MNKEKTTKRGRKKHFNGWQINAMKEMKKKGANYEQIAIRFNCVGNTVRYWIDKEFREKRKIWSRDIIKGKV